MLQVIFPAARTGAVAAATVRQNQQFIPFGVHAAAAAFPPQSDRIHRKGRRLIAGSHGYEPPVGLRIVNAIGNGHPHRIVEKIVIIHRMGLSLPRYPRIFESSDLLLLFRVDADNGASPRGEFLPLLVEVAELPVADPSGWRILVARFQILVIDAQREPHLFQQTAHGAGADPDVESAELSGYFPGRLAGPSQTLHRVSGRFMLQQIRDTVDDLRRFFSVRLRPPPALRVLSRCTCSPKSSRRPRATVCGSSPKNSAILRSPPYPSFSASKPAYRRRCCSSNKLKSKIIAVLGSGGRPSPTGDSPNSHAAGRCCRRTL